jgi:arylsulfatase A-like enzyme
MSRLVSSVALAAIAVVGCGGPTPPVDANLLIVTVDTLRADHLGVYGNNRWQDSPSPSLDALAVQGVVFDWNYAPRGQTHPSLSSLITGKYPITTGLRENGFPLPEEHRTLFEHLQAAGYQTGVFIANFEVDNPLNPIESWIARGADVKSDGFDGKRQQESGSRESRYQRTWDERVQFAALDYLDQVDSDRPFALWVHFYDVHKPYNPPPAYTHRYGPTGASVPDVLRSPGDDSGPALGQHFSEITLGTRRVPGDELARIHGLYDATVAATDDRLASILDRLDTLGERDSTYVVFTSDHGDELFDHNRYFFHGASIYDGTVKVPLVMTGPGLPAGRRVSAVTRHIDVAPTILDLLGLGESAADMEGSSLRALAEGSTDEPPAPFAVIEWQDYMYAVSDGRHKLIWNPQHIWPKKPPYFGKRVPEKVGFEIACLEGYDLTADPYEQLNLLADLPLSEAMFNAGVGLPELFKPHFAALERFLSDPRHQGGFASDTLDDDALAALKQLGYVGTGGGVDRPDSTRAPACYDER